MIVFISVLLEILIFHFFANKIFSIRPNSTHKVIIDNIFIIIVISYLLLLSKPQLNPIILFISSSFILLKYYGGVSKNKFLYIIYFILTTTISEFIVVNVTKLAIHNFIVQEYNIDFTIGALFVNIFQIIFMELYKKYAIVDLKIISIKYFIFVLILPLTTCFFILSIPNYFIIVGNKGELKLFIIVLGLLFSNLMTVYMVTQQIKSINLKFSLEELKTKEKLNSIHYAYLADRYHQNFTILHNIKKEIFSIIQNAKDCQNAEIIRISDNIYKDVSQMMILSTIGPKSLNIIIDDKISIISDNNIKFKIIFEYNDFSFMKIKDQFELFSLLLDESIFEILNNHNAYKYIMLKCRLVRDCIQLVLNYNGQIIPSINKINSIVLNYNGILVQEKKDDYTIIIITFKKRKENYIE